MATRQNLTSLLEIFKAFKDDAEASNEALKCACNALLLIEPARKLFIQKDVGGSEFTFDLLEVRPHTLLRKICSPLSIENDVSGTDFPLLAPNIPHLYLYSHCRRLHQGSYREQVPRTSRQCH